MAGDTVGARRRRMEAPHRGEDASYRLSLLGGFAATRDGLPVQVPAAAQRLVALAALYRAPLPRGLAAERLWPHLDHPSAQSSLRTAVSRLGRHHPDLIASGPRHLMLAEDVHVDVHEVEAYAGRLAAGTASGDDDGTFALSTLTQPLLPDYPDDWIALERERLQDVVLHALEAHAARLAASGKYAPALAAVHAALAIEPVRESAAAALIEIHLAEHNRVRALRCYHDFCARLRNTVGIDPSPEFHALVEAILPAH